MDLIRMMTPSLVAGASAKMGDVMYIGRGMVRVSGENFGLPQAVTDDRKMDYYWRDGAMTMISPFVGELAFRLGEVLYLKPNLRHILETNKSEFRLLEPYLMGSDINNKSYNLIPHLLQHEVIVPLERRLQSAALSPAERAKIERKIADARSVAEKLLEIFTPCEYLDQQVAKGTVTPEQAKVIKAQLERMHFITETIEKARNPLGATHARESLLPEALKKLPPAERARFAYFAQPENHALFNAVFKGPRLSNLWFSGTGLWEMCRFNNPITTWKHMRDMWALHRSPAMTEVRAGKPKAFLDLKNILAQYVAEPRGDKSPFLMKLHQLCQADDHQGLSGMLKEYTFPNVFKGAQGKQAFRASKQNTSYNIMGKIRDAIIVPELRTQHAFEAGSDAMRQAELLLQKRIGLAKLTRALNSGSMWVKLPLAMAALIILWGVVSNLTDAYYIQPFQREVVKRRGDSREFVGAVNWGAVIGGLTFLGLNRLPCIRGLGYIGGYATSVFAGLTAFGLSTALIFKHRLSQPRTLPLKQGPKDPQTQLVARYDAMVQQKFFNNTLPVPANVNHAFRQQAPVVRQYY